MSDDPVRGRRVLVTGADGFMGSHLTESLVARGAIVAALVRRTSRSSVRGHLRNLASVYDRLDLVIQADVGEVDWIASAQRWAPQWIMHLAADAFVPASFAAPREVFRANAVGTLNVLECCRTLPALERAVILSSSEVYGPYASGITEACLPEPTTPYAASKLAADRLAYSYWRSFGVPLIICRPFNSYGPRHPYDVIPLFLKAALTGAPIVVSGDGRQSRDFMYVDDVVAGLTRAAATTGADGEVFNLGTGVSTSIRQLAETVLAVTGTSSPVVFGPARQGEVTRLQCDPTKARQRLQWSAAISLEEGLRRSWEWVCRNRAYILGEDPHVP